MTSPIEYNSLPATFDPETMSLSVCGVPVRQNETVSVCGPCAGSLLRTQIHLAGYRVKPSLCKDCQGPGASFAWTRFEYPADLNMI